MERSYFTILNTFGTKMWPLEGAMLVFLSCYWRGESKVRTLWEGCGKCGLGWLDPAASPFGVFGAFRRTFLLLLLPLLHQATIAEWEAATASLCEFARLRTVRFKYN